MMDTYKNIAASSLSTSLLDQTSLLRGFASATLAKLLTEISSFIQFMAKIIMVDLRFRDGITSSSFLGKFYIKDIQGSTCHRSLKSVKLEIMDKSLLRKDAFI